MPSPGNRMRHTLPFLFLLAGCSSGGGFVPPDPDDLVVQTQQVFTGVNLSLPTSLVQAPDDASRWLAIEKAGRIVVFDNDTLNATGSTFLDITARVDSGPSEAGLLGIAFHPDFATNGEVFVSYTAPTPLTSTISRFRSIDGNLTLDPMSEEVILTVIQESGNHNGGDIAFGPGPAYYLFAAFGEGADGELYLLDYGAGTIHQITPRAVGAACGCSVFHNLESI